MASECRSRMSFPPLVPTPSSGLLLTRGPHLQVLEERVGIQVVVPHPGPLSPHGYPRSPSLSPYVPQSSCGAGAALPPQPPPFPISGPQLHLGCISGSLGSSSSTDRCAPPQLPAEVLVPCEQEQGCLDGRIIGKFLSSPHQFWGDAGHHQSRFKRRPSSPMLASAGPCLQSRADSTPAKSSAQDPALLTEQSPWSGGFISFGQGLGLIQGWVWLGHWHEPACL